jgi:HEPN domain-containing protein
MRADSLVRQLLLSAEKDLKAIKNMTDPDLFADEIFGFHAQQAVEKILKAWCPAAVLFSRLSRRLLGTASSTYTDSTPPVRAFAKQREIHQKFLRPRKEPYLRAQTGR